MRGLGVFHPRKNSLKSWYDRKGHFQKAERNRQSTHMDERTYGRTCTNE